MKKPNRSDEKYWTGTRNFDYIRYEMDLEEYIYTLELEIYNIKHSDDDEVNKDKWVSVTDRLPEEFDEYYIVAVRNKNKENGIYLIDCKVFTSDKVWEGGNTWESVTHWKNKPTLEDLE